MRFHPRWAALAALLSVIELFIAFHVRDGFVRPYLGDVLVVMLLFFAVSAVAPVRPMPLAFAVLLFASVVELTQAAGLIHRLGWEDRMLARMVLGDTFQWGDLLCYAAGAAAALAVEHQARRRPQGS